jgi:hypothetical protein
MHDAPYRLIPLPARDGTLRGHAKVSPEDYEHLTQWTWRMSTQGYALRGVTVNGRFNHIRMHRVILGLADDDPREADHRNLDRLDNRRGNLRAVTRGENLQNLTPRSNTSSAARGVAWDKESKRWMAYADIDHKRYFLGRFDDEAEAARVAREFRMERMPFATG